LHESTGSKPSDLGIFLLILTALAFAAGALRKELALTLVGGIFLAVLVYALLGTLLLWGLHRKRAYRLSSRILSRNIAAGEVGEVLLDREKAGMGRFFRIPGILIRYEIRLQTRDGREIRYLFDPDTLKNDPSPFPAPERGAYYDYHDRFFIGDILGLFHFYLPIPRQNSPRLLVLPKAAVEVIPVYVQSGGDARRQQVHYQRTDNLIDHRPYVPGDDPRRINWKLYGHGPSNELFVREGEPEPPPHSRLLILVETLADPSLYSPATGRRGVDLLCENALAAALEYESRDMDVSLGYTGGGLTEGTGADLAEILAYPAAYPLDPAVRHAVGVKALAGGRVPELSAELPAAPGDRGILVFALPRTVMDTSASMGALDRFLKGRVSAPNQKSAVDLVFLYEGDELKDAAGTCARLYGQQEGVHARQIGL
jgi:hypothetical protein